MERLQAAGVPAGVVQNGVDLVANDEQLAAREWTVAREHAVLGEHITDGLPVHFSRTPGTRERPGPLLGEANEYVYGELLGYSSEEITELMIDGALG